MTPEEKSLLERTYKTVEENNSILRGIRRSGRIANVMRIVYWAVIILLSFGAYFFIQPYLNFLTGSLGSLTNLTSSLNGGAGNASQSLQGLFK